MPKTTEKPPTREKIPEGKYLVKFENGQREIVDVNKANDLAHRDKRGFSIINWRGEPVITVAKRK